MCTFFFLCYWSNAMNVKKLLTGAAVVTAVVGGIGFAYAQTDTTNRNPDGTLRDATRPAGSLGTTGSPSTPATPNMGTTSIPPGGTLPNNTGATPNTSGSAPSTSGTTPSSSSTNPSSSGSSSSTSGTMSDNSGTRSNRTGTSAFDNSTMGTDRNSRAARADRN